MSAEHMVRTVKRELGIELSIDRLVHVGANVGQEAAAYEVAGYEGYHLEAMPREFTRLKNRCAGFPGQTAINACCDARPGVAVEFNVTSNSQSSSLLELGRHAVNYPNVELVEKIELQTTSLDQLVAEKRIPSDPSFLVLDVQGAEARVLEGGASLLQSSKLWGIMSEVSLDPLYEGGTTFDELYLNYLRPNGFFLKTANFNKKGWTDALFLKRWWRLEGEDLSPLEEHAITYSERLKNPLNKSGKCSQSSLSRWSVGKSEANRLIQRSPNGRFAFHTLDEPNSWWQVEWPKAMQFNEVLCFNRIDADARIRKRIVGAVFETSMNGEDWSTVHVVEDVFGGKNDGRPLKLSLPSTTARFFRIRQPKKQPLHLDCIRFANK